MAVHYTSRVAPMPAWLKLTSANPTEIADAIEVLMEMLDKLGGDPDLEDNADLEHDPAELADITYTEWHTRGRHKLIYKGSECGPTAYGRMHEDCEDDDPDTGVEDDPHGFDPEQDCCDAGDDLARSGPVTPSLGWWPSVERGEQPGDADDHEPSRGFMDAESYRELINDN